VHVLQTQDLIWQGVEPSTVREVNRVKRSLEVHSFSSLGYSLRDDALEAFVNLGLMNYVFQDAVRGLGDAQIFLTRLRNLTGHVCWDRFRSVVLTTVLKPSYGLGLRLMDCVRGFRGRVDLRRRYYAYPIYYTNLLSSDEEVKCLREYADYTVLFASRLLGTVRFLLVTVDPNSFAKSQSELYPVVVVGVLREGKSCC